MTHVTHADGPVMLLDTLSLLFRSFHALPPMSTSRGEPSGALYGLSALLVKLLREHRPRAVAWALDMPGPTLRQQAYPAYKAGRPVTPDPLVRQLRRLPELIEALGVPAHGVPGHEADDVLATLARQLRASGRPGLIVSGDTDLLQSARGSVAVWFVGRRQRDAVHYDEARVRERYGLAPQQVPAWKALAGDTSDNLPGVPGVGGKTATRWLVDHHDVAGVLAHVDTLKPTRLQAAVRDCAPGLLEQQALATVRDDLALPEPGWAPVEDEGIERLDTWFEGLEFRSLRPRLGALRR